MAPLFQAVFHGCAAGRHQEAFGDIYRARIVREDEGYLVHKLGALGTELGVIAAFFDPPWEKPTAGLSEAQQAWLLNHTAFCLRALGHLRNAVAPMRAGLERWVEQENWLRAASSNGNLCHLHLTLGDVALAVSAGETGIVHADQSGHDFQRIVNRTTLANALLHQGDLPAAKALFEEAEKRQAKSQPARPRLYSVWGHRYCDLLLTIGCAKEVRERAQYALDIVDGGSRNLHAIALDHLSLSQAALALGKQNEAGGQLDRAVEGLRKAGRFDHIPRGLLARAALFRETGDYGKARDDLDLAMRIAKRGEMRLHRCDAHLEHARLALAQEDRDAARKHLQSAAALVSACGYGRRTGEVEELERALA
jgi:tetratricopeptide (TPR) repeat protein